MKYETFEPNEDLKSLIKCYWTLENHSEEKTEKQIIVPDGCMEMIFHHGDLYRQYIKNNNFIIQPRSFVIGQLTRPLEIEATGKTGIFSIRFHPDGFVPFCSLPVKELENTAVSLEKLFGNDGQVLETKVISSGSTTERIHHTETFFQKRLLKDETVDRIVRSAVDTILTANGQLSVNEISKRTNINRRKLERKFSVLIGLSPKQISKTIRLQATLKKLMTEKFSSMATLANEGEYYDQAHFIKDFKEFTGLTPKEFYGDRLKMTSFFIAD